MSRYIDADAMNIYNISPADGFMVMGVTEEDIDLAPSIDIVPCQACKWYEDPNHKIFENCVKWKDSHGILLPTKPNDFCSYGERRTE